MLNNGWVVVNNGVQLFTMVNPARTQGSVRRCKHSLRTRGHHLLPSTRIAGFLQLKNGDERSTICGPCKWSFLVGNGFLAMFGGCSALLGYSKRSERWSTPAVPPSLDRGSKSFTKCPKQNKNMKTVCKENNKQTNQTMDFSTRSLHCWVEVQEPRQCIHDDVHLATWAKLSCPSIRRSSSAHGIVPKNQCFTDNHTQPWHARNQKVFMFLPN